MEVEVVMTVSVGRFRKGRTYLVDADHPVVRSPYAKVVILDETPAHIPVDTAVDDRPAPRVDRRRKKAEVTDDGPVDTESGSDQLDGESQGS